MQCRKQLLFLVMSLKGLLFVILMCNVAPLALQPHRAMLRSIHRASLDAAMLVDRVDRGRQCIFLRLV